MRTVYCCETKIVEYYLQFYDLKLHNQFLSAKTILKHCLCFIILVTSFPSKIVMLERL